MSGQRKHEIETAMKHTKTSSSLKGSELPSLFPKKVMWGISDNLKRDRMKALPSSKLDGTCTPPIGNPKTKWKVSLDMPIGFPQTVTWEHTGSTQLATHLLKSEGILWQSNRSKHPKPNFSMIALCSMVSFFMTCKKYFGPNLVKALLSTPSILFFLAYNKNRKNE